MLELSISDNAGLAITYDYRLHKYIRKLAHRRATNTDYFELLSNINPDIRAAVTRDFEAQADASRKAKEKEKTAKEKAAKEKGKGRGKGDYFYRTAVPDSEKGKEKEKEPRKRWAKEDWAAWRKRNEVGAAQATRSPSPDAEKAKKEKKK